jgi:hypothetical protein
LKELLGIQHRGRHGERAAALLRARWIVHFDVMRRAEVLQQYRALVASGETFSDEEAKRMREATTFRPYVRELPRVTKGRGALRRIVRAARKAQAAAA